ncbi:hypothetical protein [uncultured Algibacter sp.]|uniref:hypothetical protein n=1 Tax=uncultured Algibacter sp. TaxID=298659 RepID=UPI0026349CAB|nr:hypothetical protein [uncultured Algibacter sp.]
MKYLLYIVFLSGALLQAQEAVQAIFVKTVKLKGETIIAFDNFRAPYFKKDNVFYTNNVSGNLTYNNLQLGELSSVDTFNPLKINLFYKDFNTAVILDNRLAEIYKIDFNTTTPYLNVSFISTGHDNTIWIFNQDLQRLELFDYKTRSSRAQTVPIQSKVLDLKSDFNYCWLLTEKYIYTYNYFGRLIRKIGNSGYTCIGQNNENLILKKDNSLFYLQRNSDIINKIETPNLLINGFFVTNETLYIYNDETLQQFQLKIK